MPASIEWRENHCKEVRDMIFAVMGGDERIVQLCRLLAREGHEVRTFALERAGQIDGVCACAAAADAAAEADCVVLPLPVTAREGLLSAPLAAGEHSMEEILSAVDTKSVVCGGRVDAQTEALARRRHIFLADYYRREELVVKNAVATAEGAVGIIMEETPVTLWRSRVLVIGYGRVGKLLCHRLAAMGAVVTASARNHGDKAWIEAMGYTAMDTRALQGRLGEFDVIVNTVPAPLLTEELLRETRTDALLLDLASKPGGMDFSAAARLGRHAVWALGLPGEVAPLSAGEIIRESIFNILEERNGKA